MRILPESTVYSDESLYRDLNDLGYKRSRVNHGQGVYVSGDVHTNTIEGFWATVKRGISGNYHAVSTKYLQSYLDEFCFGYNNRATATNRGVFGEALARIPEAKPAPANKPVVAKTKTATPASRTRSRKTG